MKKNESLKWIRLAAQAADEKLGEDIRILDVKKQTAVADYFLFVGGSSHVHVRALEDAVRDKLREQGAKILRTDGQRGHLWRALDYGSFLVHIMDHKTREFYAPERLWDQGKPVSWKEARPRKRTPKKKPK